MGPVVAGPPVGAANPRPTCPKTHISVDAKSDIAQDGQDEDFGLRNAPMRE
jgi:hypothetical protein